MLSKPSKPKPETPTEPRITDPETVMEHVCGEDLRGIPDKTNCNTCGFPPSAHAMRYAIDSVGRDVLKQVLAPYLTLITALRQRDDTATRVQLERMEQDRDQWRSLVAQLCSKDPLGKTLDYEQARRDLGRFTEELVQARQRHEDLERALARFQKDRDDLAAAIESDIVPDAIEELCERARDNRETARWLVGEEQEGRLKILEQKAQEKERERIRVAVLKFEALEYCTMGKARVMFVRVSDLMDLVEG